MAVRDLKLGECVRALDGYVGLPALKTKGLRSVATTPMNEMFGEFLALIVFPAAAIAVTSRTSPRPARQ